MKTFTLGSLLTSIFGSRALVTRACRIVIACFFSAGIAFSETIGSALRYSTELETKQSSLTTIKEDTESIENSFKRKIERARSETLRRTEPEDGTIRDTLNAIDLAALMPAIAKPTIEMRVMPNGTLTPRGESGVVDRGVDDRREKQR